MLNMNFQVTVKYTLKPINGYKETAKSSLTVGLSGTITILQNFALLNRTFKYSSEVRTGLKDSSIEENAEY